ncbi:1-deoxy-D-xylulose-5-phosphate reductoisomerase [Gracilibacillus caseinilyticus]|uniref:1-deoxy-D-xylulose 5-phosphate reductoisomerase n=1 Tax=Gracilibacillus caseinilyticus TaxID=2932256 RepID=A0ABY4ETU0_9BACI|nr:1-deoxy-D-xylulose-5-phosphate reductoisomerase [Gracilibacillus caseinilyticus]UOQ47842.1 1-deoxy-D-xylulose-5-phosphate reductoisomerase [Gracilibacillus caseinilyticus]
MKNITLLGATGSIGLQTLDIIREHNDEFRLFAIAFGKNVDKAIDIIESFQPKKIVVQEESIRQKLLSYNDQLTILLGNEGMEEISADPDTDVLVNAVMGSIGLSATITAIRHKKQIAIANKETLVTAGHIVMAEAKKYGVDLLPVDSEHSAIYQALNGEHAKDVHKLILTASGGSFRDKKRSELHGVTVNDALNHPNWSMGAKITIDSATMMNKGLEVIEAHWLFDMAYDKIDVIQHKESIIHSMVEYVDNSVIAQLGTPDMRVPIQYALTYPDRLALPASKRLDLVEISTLHFDRMDTERFPCLGFAYEAGNKGGSLPTVLNAANEAAVDLFLKEKITFLEIEEVIADAMAHYPFIDQPDISAIQKIDQEVRQQIYEKF